MCICEYNYIRFPSYFSIQDLSDYISELGHPYLWVQAMGGLHFPTDHPQVNLIIA